MKKTAGLTVAMGVAVLVVLYAVAFRRHTVTDVAVLPPRTQLDMGTMEATELSPPADGARLIAPSDQIVGGTSNPTEVTVLAAVDSYADCRIADSEISKSPKGRMLNTLRNSLAEYRREGATVSSVFTLLVNAECAIQWSTGHELSEKDPLNRDNNYMISLSPVGKFAIEKMAHPILMDALSVGIKGVNPPLRAGRGDGGGAWLSPERERYIHAQLEEAIRRVRASQ